MKYDPDRDIDPKAWLARDESERIEAVVQYHERHRIRLPNKRVHAMIHTVVENQLALGEPYLVRSVLARLISEGLDRHEAIHAIGSVVTEEIFNVLKHKRPVNTEYVDKLQRLTAESWRRGPG